jgi:hypothetical protein
MKALVEARGNRILSFAMFGTKAGQYLNRRDVDKLGCLAACRKMVALKLIGREICRLSRFP